jgi:hypothetical protein
MYRKTSSEPLIDSKTGAVFVARPFLHFKASHEFDITLNQTTIRLSCHIIFKVEERSEAVFFGDDERLDESTPIYAVHDVHAYDDSELEIKMSGPERKAAYENIVDLFGKMLLRFFDKPALFVLPSFNEDYFKSFTELQTGALQQRIEWVHTYILQSRMLMQHFNLDTLAEVRTKLNLNRLPDEDEYDFEDRIEAAIESFAPGEYFIWLSWAEETVESVVEDVQHLLRPEAQVADLQALLFGNFLGLETELPGQDAFVIPRFKALLPGLQTTNENPQ